MGEFRGGIPQSCNLWRDAPPLATKTSNFTENIMHRLQSLARCPTPCDKDLELYRKHYAPVAISGEMPHPLRRPLHTTSDMKNSCCNLWRDAPPLATPHSLTRKINCLLLQSLARCPTPCDFDSQCGRADSAVRCNLWREALPFATHLRELYSIGIQSCNLWRDAPPLATEGRSVGVAISGEMPHPLRLPRPIERPRIMAVAISGEMPHPLRRDDQPVAHAKCREVAISGEMPHPLRHTYSVAVDVFKQGCNLWRDAPPDRKSVV